jgi:hypothetical protein
MAMVMGTILGIFMATTTAMVTVRAMATAMVKSKNLITHFLDKYLQCSLQAKIN